MTSPSLNLVNVPLAIFFLILIAKGDVAPEDIDTTNPTEKYQSESMTSMEHTFETSALTGKMSTDSVVINSQTQKDIKPRYFENSKCPHNKLCSELSGECINCCFNYSCVYGEEITVNCKVNASINCRHEDKDEKRFTRVMKCQYCYQANPDDYICEKSTCRVNGAVAQTYITKCKIKDHILCLGNREFPKKLKCNYTRGYSWSVTLILSIVLGGFGVDRFYLGMWQEGIGKLFSFGGLGVWTLVDVLLIATGYLGPADGSLFIY